MTPATYLPMIALAVFLIGAIGIFTGIVLRRGKLQRRQSFDGDPSATTREWLKREAENAKNLKNRRRYRDDQPSTL
ncbi:hypothetical protein N7E02_07630 (plasmid) [Aliirhizobium terrae]|uniref:hypothetical protein n=1 Tax=Terrirhizobium terrae TaxID=2926709 RepID=UPI0025765598|nr:hypothetical protein [Rhizobium sp. CC-CFT758]WJH38477.1 hypothetical protein N7E02_07630 [Rhizobium sp. CC-CFT758]